MRYHVKFPFVKDMAKSEVVKQGTEIDESELKPEILKSMLASGFLVDINDKKAQKVPAVQKLELEAQIPQSQKPTTPKSVEPLDGRRIAEIPIPGIKDDQPQPNNQQGRRGRPRN
jgi:hypothetical protein